MTQAIGVVRGLPYHSSFNHSCLLHCCQSCSIHSNLHHQLFPHPSKFSTLGAGPGLLTIAHTTSSSPSLTS